MGIVDDDGGLQGDGSGGERGIARLVRGREGCFCGLRVPSRVCVYIYIYICIYTCICICTYISLSLSLYIYIYIAI